MILLSLSLNRACGGGMIGFLHPCHFNPGILKTFHNDALTGHLGALKTLQAITWTLSWPGIQGVVLHYTESCCPCQRAKHSTTKPVGWMIPLDIPSRPWGTIGMDFIAKLPLSGGYDSILVIVDHLTKGIHLLPENETWSTEQFAYEFLDCFIRHHGLPDKIVSDRGSLFVSRFGKEVQRLLRVKPAPSTAWHPRTDGQTERANQTIETYLWHFVSDQQDDWSRLLPLAELVFNTSPSASTGLTPVFAEKAHHPRLNMLTQGSSIPAADDLVHWLEEAHVLLFDNLARVKELQKKYFDQRTRLAPEFQTRDWVWLLRRNIASAQPSKKLDFKRLGPFAIKKRISQDVYKLILPKDPSRLYPIFHASLLVPFIDPNTFPGGLVSKAPQGPQHNSQCFWGTQDLEAILGYQEVKGSHQFLFRWQWGSAADDTWLSGAEIDESLFPYLQQFLDTHGTTEQVLPADRSVRILL